MRNQEQGETNNTINARIKNDVIIPANSQIEPIGTKENPYCGQFIGGWWSGNNDNPIIQTSSPTPLFGVVSSNAKISNLVIHNEATGDNSKN